MSETTEILFSGEIIDGELSNRAELEKLCPDEFKNNWMRGNKWCVLAASIFFDGASPDGWKFKNPEKSINQLERLRAILTTRQSKHELKMAVAGWMLSEILSVCPEPQGRLKL